jgi:hypothetical protein
VGLFFSGQIENTFPENFGVNPLSQHNTITGGVCVYPTVFSVLLYAKSHIDSQPIWLGRSCIDHWASAGKRGKNEGAMKVAYGAQSILERQISSAFKIALLILEFLSCRYSLFKIFKWADIIYKIGPNCFRVSKKFRSIILSPPCSIK